MVTTVPKITDGLLYGPREAKRSVQRRSARERGIQNMYGSE
jgi:hypothetical protein